jgi:hypothetical protein
VCNLYSRKNKLECLFLSNISSLISYLQVTFGAVGTWIGSYRTRNVRLGDKKGRHDTKHRNIKDNDTQPKWHICDIQHNNAQYKDTQHNDTQHNDTQFNNTVDHAEVIMLNVVKLSVVMLNVVAL